MAALWLCFVVSHTDGITEGWILETYERLICDLGHCLLTKGLNNDFTPSGRDLEMDVMCTGGWTQRACRERGARNNATWQIFINFTGGEEVNLGSPTSPVNEMFLFMMQRDALKGLTSVFKPHCQFASRRFTETRRRPRRIGPPLGVSRITTCQMDKAARVRRYGPVSNIQQEPGCRCLLEAA